MGFINPRDPIAPGDQIRWGRTCLYSLETTTIGGTLYVTSSEMLLVPNRMSSRRDWGPQRMRLTNITSINVMERTGTPYNGGLRRRVRVEMRNREVHLLMIKRPDETAQELRSLVGNQGVP